MARGRIIDKAIILSKKINAVSEGAENLYYRIYVCSDDYGLFHADPQILKGQAYTMRKVAIETIKKRLKELIEIGLIRAYVINGERYLEIVGFEKHQYFRKDYTRKLYHPRPSTKSYESVQAGTKSPSININIPINIPITKVNKEKPQVELRKEIIDYFNKTTNQKRTYKNEEANKLINCRIQEGRSFEDFVHVIDTKTAQWQDDSRMRSFIRPSTLFRPGNFDDYLNEPYQDPKKKTGQLGVSRGEKPKYPASFFHSVFLAVRRQGKNKREYSEKMLAIDYYQARQLATKYKDSPEGFIQFLEEKENV